jgi:hypothetical protein
MEDVQAFLGSAREQEYLLKVDSRQRDTAVHPSPSEYGVTFASPFRNVFGLDLLDATVPRTEYIVESNANALEYALDQPASLDAWGQGAWAQGRKRRAEVPPGDYNLPQFVEQLNAVLAATAAAAGEAPLRCEPLTVPAEVSGRLALSCARPFTLLAGTSTLRYVLGFGDPVTTDASGDYAAVPGWSVNFTGGASDTFLSRPAEIPDDDEPPVATSGPLPAAPGAGLDPVFAGSTVRQRFVSAAAGPVAAVSLYAVGVAPQGQQPPALAVRVLRASDGAVMASGALAVGAEDHAYVPVQCAMTAGPTDGGLLVAGVAYYVEFSAADGDSARYVGAYRNTDNLPPDPDRYMEVNGVAAHAGQDVCCDVVLSSSGHALFGPGLADLSGPRYVNIRCPEIESHMFRDRVNEPCHVGLGMVKLRGHGFREQRFDFVSFPPRRFHPLGRLGKLTFRLERPDGSLYDSHGVDHTLLLVLRYYEADPRRPAAPSTLAPGYVPDLTRVNMARWAEEARRRR